MSPAEIDLEQTGSKLFFPLSFLLCVFVSANRELSLWIRLLPPLLLFGPLLATCGSYWLMASSAVVFIVAFFLLVKCFDHPSIT